MASLKDELKALMARKDKIESEIKALTEVLDSQGGVGMHEPLVDSQDYPRDDINVYSVRHARHNIICLQNDHKAIMAQIEDGLNRLHAEIRAGRAEPMDIEQSVSGQAAESRVAFVRVDRVDDGSPASTAGVRVGDEVVKFGSITSDNFTDLQCIGKEVQHSQGCALSLEVVREGQVVQLGLTPQTWSGRGLLGCHIVPIRR